MVGTVKIVDGSRALFSIEFLQRLRFLNQQLILS
jgi:hypothetical protein